MYQLTITPALPHPGYHLNLVHITPARVDRWGCEHKAHVKITRVSYHATKTLARFAALWLVIRSKL